LRPPFAGDGRRRPGRPEHAGEGSTRSADASGRRPEGEPRTSAVAFTAKREPRAAKIRTLAPVSEIRSGSRERAFASTGSMTQSRRSATSNPAPSRPTTQGHAAAPHGVKKASGSKITRPEVCPLGQAASRPRRCKSVCKTDSLDLRKRTQDISRVQIVRRSRCLPP
jgi:hypothetical protein